MSAFDLTARICPTLSPPPVMNAPPTLKNECPPMYYCIKKGCIYDERGNEESGFAPELSILTSLSL